MDRILRDMENSRFTYDAETDPAAIAARERYTKLGRQAMDDTIAQVAARTGGMASSYAGTAGQQMYNEYMDGLDTKLAELQQQAYNNWLAEMGLKRDNLTTLASLAGQQEESFYNAQQAAMNRWETLGYADADVAAALGVPIGAMTSGQEYQKWQQEMAQKENDRNYYGQWLDSILQTGQMPSEGMLTASGMSESDAAMLADYYKKLLDQATVKRSGSSGNGGSNNVGSQKDTGNDELRQQQMNALQEELDWLYDREIQVGGSNGNRFVVKRLAELVEQGLISTEVAQEMAARYGISLVLE